MQMSDTLKTHLRSFLENKSELYCCNIDFEGLRHAECLWSCRGGSWWRPEVHRNYSRAAPGHPPKSSFDSEPLQPWLEAHASGHADDGCCNFRISSLSYSACRGIRTTGPGHIRNLKEHGDSVGVPSWTRLQCADTSAQHHNQQLYEINCYFDPQKWSRRQNWPYHDDRTARRTCNHAVPLHLRNELHLVLRYRLHVSRMDNAQKGTHEDINGAANDRQVSRTWVRYGVFSSEELPGYEENHMCGRHQCCPKTRRELHDHVTLFIPLEEEGLNIHTEEKRVGWVLDKDYNCDVLWIRWPWQVMPSLLLLVTCRHGVACRMRT